MRSDYEKSIFHPSYHPILKSQTKEKKSLLSQNEVCGLNGLEIGPPAWTSSTPPGMENINKTNPLFQRHFSPPHLHNRAWNGDALNTDLNPPVRGLRTQFQIFSRPTGVNCPSIRLPRGKELSLLLLLSEI